MRESILTIPVNEVFEPKEGCPICRMRNSVEAHICEYIMGAAMMEPDVREETNELGFCLTHFKMLLLENNRLSLALMINSYLEINSEKLFSNKKCSSQKGIFKKKEQQPSHKESCFVCSKVDWGINHMTKTVLSLFKSEQEFKELFLQQEYFCLPHYKFLSQTAEKSLSKNDLAEFSNALDSIVKKYMESINHNVKAFCDSFDYRNAKTLHQPGNEHIKNSIPKAIRFLSGRDV